MVHRFLSRDGEDTVRVCMGRKNQFKVRKKTNTRVAIYIYSFKMEQQDCLFPRLNALVLNAIFPTYSLNAFILGLLAVPFWELIK